MAAFEFESVNFPRHFIRHANFAGAHPAFRPHSASASA